MSFILRMQGVRHGPEMLTGVVVVQALVVLGKTVARKNPNPDRAVGYNQHQLLPIDVEGALPGEKQISAFDPQRFCDGVVRPLKRPLFLGIVASATLAMTLAKKASGRVAGFVVEGPTEPLEHYLRKGGTTEQTVGRNCVCNGLPVTVALGQVRAEGPGEWPLLTAGDDLAHLAQFLPPGCDSYSAADVLRQLRPPTERTSLCAGLAAQPSA